MNAKELSFDFLDNKYKPLMHKFANKYSIPGYDIDDIIQELRMSMMKAQEMYDPNKGAAFGTYLQKTFDSKMKSIWIREQGRKKNIPAKKIISIALIVEKPIINQNELDDIEMLTGLSKEATILSKEILKGNTSNISWLATGLTQREIRLGKQEILDAITGGRKFPKFASKE